MNDLRDKFLTTVTSSSHSHSVIVDLDGLLAYSEFREILIESGYRILDANPGLDARIKYELDVRHSTDKVLLVVPDAWEPLPDIKENVHFVELELRDLLPRLSTHIVNGLSFEALDLLSKEKQYTELNDDQTLSYLFKVLYKQDLTTLKSSTSKEFVLAVLIDVFLESREVNAAVQKFLGAILVRFFPGFEDELNENTLRALLQERWKEFLTGTSDIQFEDAQLRKRVADLFLTGRLEPVKIDQARFSSLTKPLSIGCYFDLKEHQEEKFASLLDRLDEMQGDSSTLDYWRQMIPTTAEAALCSFGSTNAELKDRYSSLTTTLNVSFQHFIEFEYDKLFSLSGVKRPATVTRVLEHLKFHKAPRKALLVLDGVNYWQWTMIADALRSEGLECQSDVTTAYIPSITAWSRQAIFKGAIPDLDADNSKEDKLFRAYWAANGYQDFEVGFEKISFGGPHAELTVSESVKMLGIVANDLDDLMHSTIMGNDQLHNQTEYWLKKGSFVSEVKNLRAMGFTIFVATDHGSVEAKGLRNLKLGDKIGSVSRGKRHSRFRNEAMLQNFRDANPNLDLGTKELSVYLKNTYAFTATDQSVVTHGGSHFWEVLIPFAEI